VALSDLEKCPATRSARGLSATAELLVSTRSRVQIVKPSPRFLEVVRDRYAVCRAGRSTWT